MDTDSPTGEILRGLRQAQRKSLEDLVGPHLSHRRLELIEEGIEPTGDEIRLLAAKLNLAESPAILREGLSPGRGQQIRQELADAAAALARGERTKARAGYAAVLADPALGSRPDLWQLTELGLAQALEDDGHMTLAIDHLRHLLMVLAPNGEPLPPGAYEDLGLSEQRARVAISLSRCLREAGDLDASIQVGEHAFAVEMAEDWSDRTVELGATVLAAYLERCAVPAGGELTICQALAAVLMRAAERLGTPRALLAACRRAATVAAIAGDAQRSRRLGARALAALRQGPQTVSAIRLRAQLILDLLLASPAEHAQARRWLRQIRSELDHGVPTILDRAYCDLASAHIELASGAAASAVHQADEIITRYPSARTVGAAAQLVRARALSLAGRLRESAEALNAAGEQLVGMTAPARASQAFADCAAAWERCGEIEASTAAYRRALDTIGLTGA
ncbi:hypothetical protein [Nonomuraea sp. NPDC049695]|uniref:hypothetical protein n=1 Tax=Nonomuraea sp. NPDC049695 TaxID=3154734 RepID=UPI00341DCC33